MKEKNRTLKHALIKKFLVFSELQEACFLLYTLHYTHYIIDVLFLIYKNEESYKMILFLFDI